MESWAAGLELNDISNEFHSKPVKTLKLLDFNCSKDKCWFCLILYVCQNVESVKGDKRRLCVLEWLRLLNDRTDLGIFDRELNRQLAAVLPHMEYVLLAEGDIRLSQSTVQSLKPVVLRG